MLRLVSRMESSALKLDATLAYTLPMTTSGYSQLGAHEWIIPLLPGPSIQSTILDDIFGHC